MCYPNIDELSNFRHVEYLYSFSIPKDGRKGTQNILYTKMFFNVS